MNIALIGPAGAGKTTIANELARAAYQRIAFADPLKQMLTAWLGRPLDKARDRALLQTLGDMGRDPAWCFVGGAKHEQVKAYAAFAVDQALRSVAHHDDATMAGAYGAMLACQRLQSALYDPPAIAARGFGAPSYWVEILTRAVARGRERAWVVDDCRYPNEAEALRAAGFVLVRLDVPADVRARRLAARGEAGHAQALAAGVTTVTTHSSETDWAAIDADMSITTDSGAPEITARALLLAIGRRTA